MRPRVFTQTPCPGSVALSHVRSKGLMRSPGRQRISSRCHSPGEWIARNMAHQEKKPTAGCRARERASPRLLLGGRLLLGAPVRIGGSLALIVAILGACASSADHRRSRSLPPQEQSHEPSHQGDEKEVRLPAQPWQPSLLQGGALLRPQRNREAGADDWLTAPRASITLSSQNIVLELPQGDSWKSAGRRGTFSGILQASSQTEIWVRHQPARRTVTVQECQQEAIAQLSLLREPATTVSRSKASSPQGYAGELHAMGIQGGAQLLVVSVAPSRCFALLFRTKGQGHQQRLMIAEQEIVPQMRAPGVSERAGMIRF